MKEYRSATGRIYSCGKNKTMAEYHGKAIFYRSDEGNYREIDNSLEDKGEVYETKANTFRTRFYKQPKNGKIFEISEGASRIALTSLDAAKNCACGLENCTSGGMEKNEGRVKLKAIKGNTDLEYVAESDRIKENILINEKADDYEYEFEIDIEGLYVTVSEDGKKLELRGKETGSRRYYIPSPFMLDGKGYYSESVYYEITQSASDKLGLKVIADKNWINADERVFPVTIDPQIVVERYYGGYNYDNAYLSTGTESIFRYRTWCNDQETGYDALWSHYDTENDQRFLITSDLIISVDKIPERLKNKLISAQLIIYVDPQSYGYEFRIGDTVYENANSYQKITLDLTNQIKSGEKEIVISFSPQSSRGDYINQDIKYYSPILQLKAETDYYGGEENVVPATKAVKIAGGAESLVYLQDGKAVTVFRSFDLSDFVLPLQISHVYRQSLNNTVYGAGWRLNLNKKLKAATEDTSQTTKYVYTDEFGDEYLFLEKYYYLNNGKKYFINKNSVTISAEGELTYSGKPVYTQQICNGYTLISEIDDFIDSEFIEQRQEELAQLEDYVNQYAPSLKAYAKVQASTGVINMSMSSLTKNNYKSLINGVTKNSTYILMSSSEAYQLQSLYLNVQQLDEEIDECTQNISEAQDVMDKNTNDQEGDAYKDAAESKTKNEEARTRLRNQKTITNNQIQFTITNAQNNLENIKQMFKNYFAKEAQLQLMRLLAPVNYIKDENGIISGFNENGDFVAAFDSYGNYVAVGYDSSGRISEIYDSKNTVLQFKYSNNRLQRLTDGFGRSVKYTYTGDNLTSVTFADGRTLSFAYEYEQLQSVRSTESERTDYSYDISRRVSEIKNLSKPVTVGQTITGTGSDHTKLLSQVRFAYGSTYTTVTDEENNTEKYTFLSDGKVSSYQETDSEGNKTTVNYTYTTLTSGKKITAVSQENSEAAVTSITQYNDIGKVVSKTRDWQRISATVRVKTVVNYSYDDDNLLTEKKELQYRETSGKSSTKTSYVKYSYNAQGQLVLTESYVNGEELTSGVNYEQKVYDENGNVTKTISWNSLDSSSKFYTESEVAENGQVTADKDETGATSAEYEYMSGSNVVNSVKYPNGSRFAYGRDPYNFAVTSVTQSTEDGEANTNDIVYKYGLPVEVKSGNTVIDYTYDHKGRKTKVEIDGVQQATYGYTDYGKNGSSITYGTTTQTLADGTVMVTSKTGEADSVGRVKVTESVKANGTTVLSTLYNADGLAEQVTDSVSGTKTYTYDSYKNVTQVKTVKSSAAVLTEGYTYNGNAELTQRTLTGAVNHTYTYSYKDNAARDLEYVGIDSYKFYPLADVNGRNTGREIYNGTAQVAGEYIRYRKVGDHATNMPSAVWFGLKREAKEGLKYRYDASGNISEIMQNGHIAAKYAYDALGRLIREDNKSMNKTVLFTYDENGNITERCEYAYTSKTGEELAELAGTHYGYVYDGDKLISYNGENCAYNALGNPTTYRGKALEWQYGNRLTKYGTTTFTYDGAGRRVSKGSISFTYDSDGRLIKQSDGLEFIYDHSGIAGVKYNGNIYFYRKDAQGNIMALLDSNGAVVVEYKYDAWGNHEAEVANEAFVALAEINPYRYRGYYFDEETGLYFLQTRYYDPEVGRFISRDSIEYAAPETINGLNLYAYCSNNPVMATDPLGTTAWWEWLLAGLVVVGLVIGAVVATVATGGMFTAAITGAAIGAGISLGTQAMSGSLNWGQFALDIGVGAITGLIGASSISRIGSTFVGAVIGGGSNIASQLLDGKSFSEINWKTVGLSTIVGGVSGFIGGAGAKNTKAFQRSLSRNSGWNKAMSSFYKVQGKIAAGVYSKSGAAGANALVNYMLSQAYINALKQFEKQAIRSALKIYGIFTGTQAFTLALFEIFEVEFFA